MYVFLENKAFRAACFFVTLPIPRKGNWFRPVVMRTATVIYSSVPAAFIPLCLRRGHGGPLATGRVREKTRRGWGRREENGGGAGRTSTHKEK